ncbi:MAG: iron chelate uptake ABC transporter family permease subunit, partial [Solirubrobacteraceae bacterium]|nr:iron chelate uptake ABC transporter family permease subunit [Solirubrobacteraceae bacterium]
MSTQTAPSPSRFNGTEPDGAAPATGVVKRIRGSAGGRSAILLLLAAILGLCVLLSLSVGARGIPLADVWREIFSPTGSRAGEIVRELRAPRTLLGLEVGIALGIAGTLMQAMTRNPLADPGLLGVNAGAATAVVVGIIVFGITSLMGYVWLALGGA